MEIDIKVTLNNYLIIFPSGSSMPVDSREEVLEIVDKILRNFRKQLRQNEWDIIRDIQGIGVST